MNARSEPAGSQAGTSNIPEGEGQGRRKGPKPRADANKELVHLRISPGLYDQLKRWADEDDVSFSHEVRALVWLGRMVADHPAVLKQMLRDPSASRTKIVRGVEREADLRTPRPEEGHVVPAI
jgi:hypothetical protein